MFDWSLYFDGVVETRIRRTFDAQSPARKLALKKILMKRIQTAVDVDKLKATWNEDEIDDAKKDEIDDLPLNELLANELDSVQATVGFNFVLSEVN